MRNTLVNILDYGVGNLHSLEKAVVAAGATPRIVSDPLDATWGSHLLLPGVGAFEPAAERLARGREPLREAILAGLPTLGICLGMQLLFDGSEEGPGEGLGVIPGRVTRLAAATLPHIGWNAVDDGTEPLLHTSGLRDAYYANSYVCRPADPAAVTAWSTHDGDRFAAVVRQGRVVGAQFHPEKSSAPGIAFLRAFIEETRS